jgi:histidinol-phosphate aminotransferase
MIDLSDNTNAWGMPPAARRAIAESIPSPRYPSAYADALKAAAADYLGLEPQMITTGCGSDDVLDAAFRALGRPGERLAYPSPTFAMVPIFAAANRMTPTPTPLADLATCGARIIYLCSPNNPTGVPIARAVVESLLARVTSDQVVIVDEAYAEFAGASMTDLVPRCDRLIVTRTMSKAFGLASLRIGYCAADPALIDAIERVRGPFRVNAIGERAAVAGLRDGRDWMSAHAAKATEAREWLVGELQARGLNPPPSAANFVFAPMPEAASIAERMLARAVRVRAFDEPSGIRITVSAPEQMAAALNALDEARRCE